jgi:hypothetical protein
MQNYDFSLIIREFAERTPQILLSGIIPVRRTKPLRDDVESPISTLKLCIVKDRVAHTSKKIGFLVCGLA